MGWSTTYLLESLLVSTPLLYCDWQQSERISGDSRGVGTILRKDVDNGDVLEKFRSFNLSNTELKIFASSNVKRLVGKQYSEMEDGTDNAWKKFKNNRIQIKYLPNGVRVPTDLSTVHETNNNDSQENNRCSCVQKVPTKS